MSLLEEVLPDFVWIVHIMKTVGTAPLIVAIKDSGSIGEQLEFICTRYATLCGFYPNSNSHKTQIRLRALSPSTLF